LTGIPTGSIDFGGTLGGPVWIPHLYNGKDKTFFFFSYEGLRLLQPQAATRSRVADTYLRTCTAAPLRQVWNAFPQPNVPGPAPDCTKPDPNTTAVADFVSTWSNPGSLDAYSIRFDHSFGDKLKLFFRFADTPSVASNRLSDATGAGTPSVIQASQSTARLYTFGATTVLTPRLSNDLRIGYSSTSAHLRDSIDNFGGAVPIDLGQLQQVRNSPAGYFIEMDLLTGPTNPALIQRVFLRVTAPTERHRLLKRPVWAPPTQGWLRLSKANPCRGIWVSHTGLFVLLDERRDRKHP